MHRGKKHTRKYKHRRMRGGKGIMSPSYESVNNDSGSESGWRNVYGKVGDLNQQFTKALVGNGPGTNLVVSGQQSPMTGGRKRKGGSFAPVISDAIVPLTLLAAQQSYGRKNKRTRKTRRTRRKY